MPEEFTVLTLNIHKGFSASNLRYILGPGYKQGGAALPRQSCSRSSCSLAFFRCIDTVELGLEIFSASCNRWLECYFKEMLETAQLLNAEEADSRSRPTQYRDAIAWLFSPYL